MMPMVSIGNQDFVSIRENKSFYIDKTDFIREWWENQDTVTLITRPRRFGKTLNMRMLEAFFSNQYAGRSDLFEGLSIWKEEKYRKLQGCYPVIFLSFADIKGNTYETARMGMIRKLVKLYSTCSFVRTSGKLGEKELAYFDSVDEKMEDDAAAVAINYMSDYLSRYYGQKVIILLDEYDTPLQEAYVHGYWDRLTAFVRSLFNSTFKTNPYMERAVMTGITRISKESIFSDINNLAVITTTTERYATSFGFTQEEVFSTLDRYGMSDKKDDVKRWYDGFAFGNHKDIYNPWSITCFLKEKKLKSYWANTSANSLVGRLIREGTPDIKVAVEDLLAGKQIEVAVDEEIVFNQLDESDSAIWSLLLASGYLKVDNMPEDGEEQPYVLSLTNLEVSRMFRKMIRGWFARSDVRYNDFVKALFLDDVAHMNRFMNQMTENVFSFFDTGNRASEKSEPERFYHGFVLGLIADSSIPYTITSNRESGFGRYDVVMEPKNKLDNAYVFEFKVFDPDTEKTLEDTVKAAHMQMDEKKYDAALLARGIAREKIRHYGFAFEGKKVLIG